MSRIRVLEKWFPATPERDEPTRSMKSAWASEGAEGRATSTRMQRPKPGRVSVLANPIMLPQIRTPSFGIPSDSSVCSG